MHYFMDIKLIPNNILFIAFKMLKKFLNITIKFDNMFIYVDKLLYLNENTIIIIILLK